MDPLQNKMSLGVSPEIDISEICFPELESMQEEQVQQPQAEEALDLSMRKYKKLSIFADLLDKLLDDPMQKLQPQLRDRWRHVATKLRGPTASSGLRPKTLLLIEELVTILTSELNGFDKELNTVKALLGSIADEVLRQPIKRYYTGVPELDDPTEELYELESLSLGNTLEQEQLTNSEKVLANEIDKLQQTAKFRILTEPHIDKWHEVQMLICFYEGNNALTSNIPPIFLNVSPEYPKKSPTVIFPDDYFNGGSFLRAVREELNVRMYELLGRCTVSTILFIWEIIIRKASCDRISTCKGAYSNYITAEH